MQEKSLYIILFKETHPSFLESMGMLEGEEGFYSITKKEIADEIRRRKINRMDRYVSTVFKEGNPPSYLLKLCSPEAAERKIEEDLVARQAEKLGINVVYLDDGFENVNPYAKIVKKLSDQISLYREMIQQIQEKRGYLRGKLKECQKEIRELPQNSEEQKKLSKKIGHIANKIIATYAYNDPTIDSCYYPLDVFSQKYRVAIPGEEMLVAESARKFNSAIEIIMSARYQKGREDFWMDKFEKKVENLPLGSKVNVFVGAGHIDGLTVKGFDFNWFDLQRNRELNEVMGHFGKKLEEKFGKFDEIDLTKETIKEELLKKRLK